MRTVENKALMRIYRKDLTQPSKLLDKAILISQTKYAKNGTPYQAVSREMEISLEISGSIQRSIPPRLIRGEGNLDNLKQILGMI